MFLSKVKTIAIVVLAVGIAGAGTGFLGYRSDAETPPSKPSPPAANSAPGRVEAPAPALAKAKAPAQPNVNPPAQDNVASRLRERLSQEIDYGGLEDAQATLSDALDQLSKRYNPNYDINQDAFDLNPLNDGEPLRRAKICDTPIPPMRATFSTVLRRILRRVHATYLIRRNWIEITTEAAVRAELGIPSDRPLLPLVGDTLTNDLLAESLRRLTRQSGFNIVIDPRIVDKLQKITATVEFNNVPVDTAIRLLANMAGMSMVRLDNVLYVTTAKNAKHLREEQAQINADKPVASTEPPKKPAPEKPKLP